MTTSSPACNSAVNAAMVDAMPEELASAACVFELRHDVFEGDRIGQTETSVNKAGLLSLPDGVHRVEIRKIVNTGLKNRHRRRCAEGFDLLFARVRARCAVTHANSVEV